MYTNDDIQNILRGLKNPRNYDIFEKKIDFVTDNQIDIYQIKDCIHEGWYERFDRYDSAICETFLCIVEKMYSDAIAVINNMEITDEFVKYTLDGIAKESVSESDYNGYKDFLNKCMHEYRLEEKVSALATCDYKVAQFFEHSATEFTRRAKTDEEKIVEIEEPETEIEEFSPNDDYDIEEEI